MNINLATQVRLIILVVSIFFLYSINTNAQTLGQKIEEDMGNQELQISRQFSLSVHNLLYIKGWTLNDLEAALGTEKIQCIMDLKCTVIRKEIEEIAKVLDAQVEFNSSSYVLVARY